MVVPSMGSVDCNEGDLISGSGKPAVLYLLQRKAFSKGRSFYFAIDRTLTIFFQ